MSECQYHEFAAVDRPLTDDGMAALRAMSRRATITPTRFVNQVESGGLKADPSEMNRPGFRGARRTAHQPGQTRRRRARRDHRLATVIGRSGHPD